MKTAVDEIRQSNRAPLSCNAAHLLQRSLHAWVLSAPASERRNSRPATRPAPRRRCRGSHGKRFRPRDARSNSAGRRVRAPTRRGCTPGGIDLIGFCDLLHCGVPAGLQHFLPPERPCGLLHERTVDLGRHRRHRRTFRGQLSAAAITHGEEDMLSSQAQAVGSSSMLSTEKAIVLQSHRIGKAFSGYCWSILISVHIV